MLMLPPTVKVYLALTPVDLRKSFDGLSLATRNIIDKEPLSGHLVVFLNKRKDRVKVLVWDKNGFCLLYKRLEKGTFYVAWAANEGMQHAEIESGELALLLEGIDLRGAHKRPRWQPMSTTVT